MPRLYEYTDGSDRGTGYYVRAGVDGSVVTLQANPIVEELYDALGYKAGTYPDGGDELPGRLVWSLYDVGLHYTEKQGVDTNREEVLNSLQQGDVQLKQHETNKLREFIQRNLDKNEELSQVAEDFGIEIEKGQKEGYEKGRDSKENGDVGGLTEIWEKVTQKESAEDKPRLPIDIKPCVDEWGLTDSDEFTQLLSKNEEIQESIRRMSEHEWEVEKAVDSKEKYKIESEGETVEYQMTGIAYQISLESIEVDFPSEQWEVAVYDPCILDAEVEDDRSTNGFFTHLHAPMLDEPMSLVIADGYINRINTETYEKQSEEEHRRLGCLSFLYDVSVEFANILDGYELSNPCVQKVEGTVKFSHDKAGYGFIEPDGSSEYDGDVFFHMNDVGGPKLEEGRRVKFEITEGEEGPRAKNLERI